MKRLQGRISAVTPGRSPTNPLMTTVELERGGLEMLMGVEHAIAPRVGANVELELVPGGPLGQHWKIMRIAGGGAVWS